jgi:hypothetical protein
MRLELILVLWDGDVKYMQFISRLFSNTPKRLIICPNVQ